MVPWRRAASSPGSAETIHSHAEDRTEVVVEVIEAAATASSPNKIFPNVEVTLTPEVGADIHAITADDGKAKFLNSCFSLSL